MKKLLSILLLFCIGLSYTLAQTPEIVIVFGDDEFYYSPAKKEIWFYKSNSFESDYDRGIKHIYGSSVTKNKSLDVHWKEESTFWEIDYENYAILSFDLPNNKNCDRVLLDSTVMWISYNGKEKNKIPFDEAIIILEKVFQNWSYEVEQLGPFYFPKSKKHFRKWRWSEGQKKFGYFYPEDLKSWAQEAKGKQTNYILSPEWSKMYRLPLDCKGDYLYIKCRASLLKQSFYSTTILYGWKPAWKSFDKRIFKEKKQKRFLKKVFTQ